MKEPNAVIDWILTTECNLNCPYCLMGNHGQRARAPVIDVSFIERLPKSATFLFHLTGGEPFLVPNLPEICQTLQSCQQWVSINTNLVSSVDHFIQEVSPLQVAYINCSVHYWLRKGHMAPFQRHFEELTRAGFFAFATVVADPSCFDDICTFVEYECLGIPVYLKLIRGFYGKARYPASYTLQQQLRIAQINHRTAIQLQLQDPIKFTMLLRYGMSIDDFLNGTIPDADKMCFDGLHYLRITELGEIIGCQGKHIGHIDDGITLLQDRFCPYKIRIGTHRHLCGNKDENSITNRAD